jgi:hypothetical protein
MDTILLTQHAQVRAQQRGIRPQTIELVLEMGDRKVRLPGNSFAISVSKSRALELVRLGVPAADVERTTNVVAVINGNDGAVITVEHRTRRFFH